VLHRATVFHWLIRAASEFLSLFSSLLSLELFFKYQKPSFPEGPKIEFIDIIGHLQL
jgi:hypothetical protein